MKLIMSKNTEEQKEWEHYMNVTLNMWLAYTRNVFHPNNYLSDTERKYAFETAEIMHNFLSLYNAADIDFYQKYTEKKLKEIFGNWTNPESDISKEARNTFGCVRQITEILPRIEKISSHLRERY